MKKQLVPFAFGLLTSILLLPACRENTSTSTKTESTDMSQWTVDAAELRPQGAWEQTDFGWALQDSSGTLLVDVDVPVHGRYRVLLQANPADGATAWVEDYRDNPDDRTYNITGLLGDGTHPDPAYAWAREGSPLDSGVHRMRIHVDGAGTAIRGLQFQRLVKARTPGKVFAQTMTGDAWELVWSDEFDGSGLPDTTKWTYDIGDWGWGNNERQYYTAGRMENVRQENGMLVIEARKNDMGKPWTSARLTTRGKASFTRGKIEFRAKVPAPKGCWSAGWTLGADYRDEISWPYCGEIDILESVGFETDDATGDGKAHASVHTRAYYFKQGNHLTASVPVEDISESFHDYAVVWTKDSIAGYVDGEHYYTYAQKESSLAWPFDDPQTIILNLAMGGGWGGPIKEDLQSAQFLVDYVRVYARP